jgi:hypothetical protein
VSYATAEHFAKTHGGFIAIKRFQELLNVKVDCFVRGKKGKRHLSLIEIAEKIQLSPSQVCRLRNGLFEQQWVTRRGTQEYVEQEIRHFEGLVKEREDFVEEQKKLQFIPGRVDEQNRA